ncbi:MAG: CotH kinase family protein [Treponema sp.]|nr:CotH kinase family protein [Treponema sp.]
MRACMSGCYAALISAPAAVLLCAACSMSPIDGPVDQRSFPPVMTSEEAAAHIGSGFRADPAFYSHLPLVVIDTGGEEILPSYRWDYEHGYAAAIPGAKPYVRADLRIFDNETGANSLSGEPAFTSSVQIRLDTPPFVNDEKGQYRINLITGGNSELEAPLLGMDSGSEWALLGSARDSSLLRDYLAFTLAAQIMEFTPDARYCEVLFKNGNDYFYHGVYLLAETVGMGPGRIDFSSRSGTVNIYTIINNISGALKLAGTETPPYIIQRGIFVPDGVMLETWATREKLSFGYLNLIYPEEDVSGAMIQRIEESVSRVERALYSDNPVSYVNYTKYVDMDSFVDYYLLNEFMMNFNAGFRSTYLFLDDRGRIRIGPVWDNLVAFDNNPGEAADPNETAFYKAPWFDRMTRDIFFLNRLEQRYSKLRRSVLSDEKIVSLADTTARWLGPARQRDWLRWSRSYTALLAGTGRPGFAGTGPQERIKIKYLAIEHAQVIGDRIRRMAWGQSLMDSSYSNSRSALLALGFAVLYFVTVHFGRHH